MAIVNVAAVAHCVAGFGVNVYVVVAVLLIAGNHVPVMAGALVDEVGKAGIAAPLQKGPTAAKAGTTGVGAVSSTELSWTLKGATHP